MDIGTLIRQIRKSSGMTQMELAEKMGLTYQQVQKYEKGASELTIKRLRQLADALNVPPSTFIKNTADEADFKEMPSDDNEIKCLMLFRGIKNKKLAIRILKAISEVQIE